MFGSLGVIFVMKPSHTEFIDVTFPVNVRMCTPGISNSGNTKHFLAQASIHDFTMEIRCYFMPMGKSSLEQTKLEKHGLSVDYEYVHQLLLSLPI